MMRIRPDPDPQHCGALYVVILKRGYPGTVILKNGQILIGWQKKSKWEVSGMTTKYESANRDHDPDQKVSYHYQE